MPSDWESWTQYRMVQISCGKQYKTGESGCYSCVARNAIGRAVNVTHCLIVGKSVLFMGFWSYWTYMRGKNCRAFNRHYICRSPFCALTNIGKICRSLDQETSASLVNALVISRLDHCNSLLIGLPKYELQKLQKVFNTAARIGLWTRPDAHITPVLKSLHCTGCRLKQDYSSRSLSPVSYTHLTLPTNREV